MDDFGIDGFCRGGEYRDRHVDRLAGRHRRVQRWALFRDCAGHLPSISRLRVGLRLHGYSGSPEHSAIDIAQCDVLGAA